MHNIVITVGTAVGSVLALAEAIKKEASCKVFVLCTDEKTTSVISSSRFVDVATYISANQNPEFVEFIQGWYQSQGFVAKPAFYSTTDTSCYLVDQYRDWFEQHFFLSIPSSEIIKVFTKKGEAEFAAEKAGLAIPRTAVLKQRADLKETLKEFSFPIILKPRAAYMKGMIDFKIKVLFNIVETVAFTEKYLSNGDELLCQEFILGHSEASYYYLFYRSQDGVVSSSMGIKALQSSKDGGIMLKGKSLFNKVLDAQCRMFLKNIDYVGMGGIEFKKSGDTFYFIEMSVRLEGFYKIAEATGVPLGAISYSNLLGEPLEEKYKNIKQQDGVVYIAWLPTMLNHFKNKKFKDLLVDALASLINPRFTLNIFSKKSPYPFFKEIFHRLFRA